MLNKCDVDGLRQTAAARPLGPATAVAPRRAPTTSGRAAILTLKLFFSVKQKIVFPDAVSACRATRGRRPGLIGAPGAGGFRLAMFFFSPPNAGSLAIAHRGDSAPAQADRRNRRNSIARHQT